MSKKYKIILSITLPLVLIVFVGVMVGVFLLNFNNDVPQSVTILQYNGKAYALAQQRDGYEGYRFIFSAKSGDVVIESQTPRVELSQNEKFVVGEDYLVYLQYISKVEGGSSKRSKAVHYSAIKKLESPVLTLGPSNLVWTAVDGATSYTVYYSGKSVETADTSMSLNNLSGGVHDIFVVANAGNKFVSSSDPSNTVNKTVIHQIADFTSSSHYDGMTGNLILQSREELEYCEVQVSENSYKVQLKLTAQSNGVYSYSACIEAIANKVYSFVTVKPYSQGAYNSYTGQGITVSITG